MNSDVNPETGEAASAASALQWLAVVRTALVWMVALAGCTDGEDVCVPHGRVFLDSNEGIHLDGSSKEPQPVAIGGIERLAVRCSNGGHGVPLYPGLFVVDTVGDAVAVAETEHGLVTIAGVHEGSTGIAILDPGNHRRLDADVVEARAVDGASFFEGSYPTTRPVAFAPDTTVRLELRSGDALVVDDAMTLAIRDVRGPSEAPSLDLKGVPVGDYTLDVKGGDQNLTMPLIITNVVDTIALQGPATVDRVSNHVCFDAMHGDRAILDLDGWTFVVEGANVDSVGRNCVYLLLGTEAGPPITVTATVAGVTATVTVTHERGPA